MDRMLGFMGTCALLGALTVSAETEAQAQEELIVNGGFESPQLSSSTWHTFTSIPGWGLSYGPSIEVQKRVAGSPYEGNQFVELDSHSNSGIFQDISTSPRASYRLSLAFSPRPGTSADDNILEIYWAGELLATVTRPGNGLSDTRWTRLSYNVTATSSTTRLELRDAGISNGLGTYVDAVSLQPW